MEKVNRSIDEKFSYVRLYLDDIEKIVAILKKANPLKIEFESNDVLFGFDEIKSLEFEETNELYIRTEIPRNSDFPFYCLFSISFKYGYISCSRNDLTTQGLSKEIKDFLISKKRFFSNIFPQNPLTFFLQGLALSLLFSAIITNKYIVLISSKYNILCFCLIVFLIPLFIPGKNIIHLKRKKDLPSFFSRNRDDIYKIIFSSIISLISGYLLGKYLK